MADREKVFDGLKCLADDDACCHSDCPYFDNRITTSCFQRMAQDALELLKEQQETIVSLQSTINKLTKAIAEQPDQKHGHWISYGYGYYRCSVCNDGKNMNFVPDYCSTCGAKMDEGEMQNAES